MQRDLIHDFAATLDGRWLVTTGFRETQVTDRVAGLPITPIFGNESPNLNVGITTDGSRAVIGGFDENLIALDLKELTTPSTEPLEEMTILAELSASQRINENGQVVPLSREEWLQRWRKLKERYPQAVAWPGLKTGKK